MNEARALDALLRISRSVGRDPLLVQAGGGNVSLKTPGGGMLIKASGARLRQLSRRAGWTRASVLAIRRGLAELNARKPTPRRELGYAALLGRAGKAGRARVSMEAGFHAAIREEQVAHVHSIAGILLGFEPAERALKRVRRIFGDRVRARLVPACPPGLELTLLVRKTGGAPAGGADARLWILRNHGLIWAADGERELLAASRRLERVLRAEYGLHRFPPPHAAGARGCRRRPSGAADASWREFCFCRWPRCRLSLTPLFPDFLIYFHGLDGRVSGLELVPPRAFRVRSGGAHPIRDLVEVFYAHALVTTLAGRGVRPLPGKLLRPIRGLETERLRLEQAGRK